MPSAPATGKGGGGPLTAGGTGAGCPPGAGAGAGPGPAPVSGADPAGGAADGSEMVIFDLMGFIPESAMAKHSKAYGSFLMDGIKACAGFAGEINSKAYPAEENGWSMDERELEKFLNAVEHA